jgi:hypothetical protein
MEGMADNETDEDEDHENDEEDIFDEVDHLFEDHENSKGGINDNTEDGEIEELADKQTFKTGDYVKIFKGICRCLLQLLARVMGMKLKLNILRSKIDGGCLTLFHTG